MEDINFTNFCKEYLPTNGEALSIYRRKMFSTFSQVVTSKHTYWSIDVDLVNITMMVNELNLLSLECLDNSLLSYLKEKINPKCEKFVFTLGGNGSKVDPYLYIIPHPHNIKNPFLEASKLEKISILDLEDNIDITLQLFNNRDNVIEELTSKNDKFIDFVTFVLEPVLEYFRSRSPNGRI